MLRYTIRRLSLLIPTLLIVSWIGFGLTRLAPGDPVLEALQLQQRSALGDQRAGAKLYRETAASLGLDKPVFYVSLLPLAYPDTLYRIVWPERRALHLALLNYSGHWAESATYVHSLERFNGQLDTVSSGALDPGLSEAIGRLADRLFIFATPESYASKLDELRTLLHRLEPASDLRLGAEAVLTDYASLADHPQPLFLFLPKVAWHGLDNQYHHWLSGYFRGDFGRSYHDGQPVAAKVWRAWSWTLILNGLAILLAYGLSIPLGVWLGVRQGSRLEHVVSRGLFFMYAMPTFWIGSLCLVFFTTPEYGMDWFPTLGPDTLALQGSTWQLFWGRLPHFVLPVVCLTYPALALISRQVRGGMVEALRQPYVRAARARGLSRASILWRHAFRNALFPLITLAASILPELFTGSVAIEIIFNIPGMGMLTVNSIYRGDWPVVYAILMVGALLTVLGLLLADLFYHFADPRLLERSAEGPHPPNDTHAA